MSVLITGATSSIGQATKNIFSSYGKEIIQLGRNSKIDSDSLSKKQIHYFQLDFSSSKFEDDIDSVFSNIDLKSIETVVHLAAEAGDRNNISSMTYEEISRLSRINFINSIWFTKVSCDALAYRSISNNKAYIYVSTQLAKYQAPGLSIYSAAKAGMNNLCKSLAYEYGPNDLRINIVSPGKVDLINLENPIAPVKGIPLGRLATPKDIAETIYFLSSTRSSYISGTNIDVNGGR
ncbi:MULTISPECIES: SDR family NAD(P)-dependent oxidoreductase [unclassified Prochlorococcus]|uniref:SDR family NAD(P)-dependent oxidoreductase n=1 Tax=unclassified Prochlorococcus TaxID=2627481 RepID=UPI00053391FC|nr:MULTISPECIES: SDR family oxidoreductase [unclassified Prochlorococcus]KGG16336.1 short chain dehydrogenase [Prochlorococcus sp. MIT 0603]KGG17930.1 short chain dehydrogenase [Prochlorococcus sp. MIT 0602]